MRLGFITCGLALLAAAANTGIPANAALADEGAAVSERPNVVFILTDDQRWNCLGLADSSVMSTPNIDRLGREGVFFRNAFCTTSLCSPSRASILGGLYAHSHGVVNNFTEYPVDLPTFPRQLQKAGYQTAYIGKYHMG
jgi:N-acetylglucosamine-6-sulfatase